MEQGRTKNASPMPLSAAQQRMWVLEQLHAGKALGNVGVGLSWEGILDHAALEKALNDAARHHNILWREFQVVNGAPMQLVSPAERIGVVRVDLRGPADGDRENRLARLRAEEISKAFDLTRGPLIRATLVLLSGTEQVLLLIAHRIICDPTSLKILAREISETYQARVQGVDAGASAESRQYDDSASRPVSADDISFWKKQLSRASSTIDLPTDRTRPAMQSFVGASQPLQIEAPLATKLRRFSEEHGVSLFVTLLAAFEVLLARYTRQEDLTIGTTVSGRGETENEQTVGPLENMLALCAPVPMDLSFGEFLAQVRDMVSEALLHQGVAFESLLSELRLDRDMSRHPVFQVRFDLLDSGLESESGFKIFDLENQTEQFDLRVEVRESNGGLDVRFAYSTDLFEDSTISRMMEHYRILLEGALTDPTLAISRIPMLGQAERDQLLIEWNDSRVDYPHDLPLHHFIEAQVEKTPDAVAVVYESQQVTYRQMNDRANQLARYLRENGVGPEIFVGVCAERSIELVVALLASMKAGGAYVPLDPEYPKDRLETMVVDANPPVILTQARLLDRLPKGKNKVFCLDRDWASLKDQKTENLTPNVDGKNLAYAIFTSGSTGKPKGVPNVHEGIVNRLLWMQDMKLLTGKDRVLQKTPFSFDVSVWEFFWPLINGAALVMARPGGHRDPAYLVDVIAKQKITTLHFVPSMLSIFLEAGGLDRCGSVRQVFCSGEALPFELQQRFFERMNADLHNLYGPTEAAVEVTYWRCRRNSDRPVVPIGQTVANTQLYVLDPNLQPTPIGIPGELHIGGVQLARGYLNRPDLTAEKFIPDPFSSVPGARLYKTGDLARFLTDGAIEYLGRTDFQVKLRGLRIELGEIESVLGRCEGIVQAVVVVREDRPGDKRLVAYMTASPGWQPDDAILRRELKAQLPGYMVPSRFVLLESFPMTTSGKVDRKSLPVPPLEDRDETSKVAPRDDIEAMVASLFAKVLGLPKVGVTENFFELGGHSLLAGRLLAQINEATGRQIPLSAMFRGATVESLAKLVAFGSENVRDPILMRIHAGDSSRVPFFAIVPPGEESLGYAMLARHMGSDQPVYKIQGHAPVTGGKRPYSEGEMRALTDEYVAAMRSVQPHGPYCVGGFCDGTHIAEQVVLRLESEREEVGLLAVFDTWVLQHSQNRFLWKIYYYGQRVQQMKNLSVSDRLASYRRAAANKVQKLAGSKPSRTDWRETYWPKDFTVTRFRAPVVLFKRPKQPFYYVNDPQMGWGHRSAGGVTIHEVDFHHAHILREPHVGVFGKKLAEHMAQLTVSSQEESFAATVAGRQGE